MPIEYLPPRSDLPTYHVYAALCQDHSGQGYVKFGYSGRIDKRLFAVSSSSPIPVGYFAVVEVFHKDTAKMLEADLHKRFGHRRSNGEWFRFDFTSKQDKHEFNAGCRHSFVDCGLASFQWDKINAKELAKYQKERQRMFLNSKHRKKISANAFAEMQRRRAAKELDAYR